MPFPFDPSPLTLWKLHRDGKVASCELRFVPNGNQVQMLRNGSVLISRIFFSGEEALAWAQEERETLQTAGWRTEQDTDDAAASES